MIRNGDFGGGLFPGIFGLLALVAGIAIYQQTGQAALNTLSPGTEKSEESPQGEGAGSDAGSYIRPADKLLAEFLNVDFKQDRQNEPEQGGKVEQNSNGGLFKVALMSGVSQVSLVIATIPDYVDSSGYWVADQMIDAVQRGASALGYQLDRFWLPDSEIASDSTLSPSNLTLHETQPGVILFRRVVDHSNAKVHLLAVFLVNEIPTTGIHQEAFFEAVRIVNEWGQKARHYCIDGLGADGKLLVLGPTFSGSALSLRGAIKALDQKGLTSMPESIRIVSGTATNPNNLEMLTFSSTSFSATVHTDDDLQNALARYLRWLNPKWEKGNRVALIMESNTVYGSGFEQKDDSKETQDEVDPGETQNVDDFSKAIRMTFPIHISRLRSVAGSVQNQLLQGSTQQPRQGIGINMGVRSIASDRIPSFSPDMTSSVVELTLANILDTIRRENIGAVGIFATDKRDHLFLSREIIRRAPNVLLFATESDLLLIQREFRSFIKGTIVASSYPLFSGTQQLTNSRQAAKVRMQFPSMGTQGVYNAMLALLDPSCFQPGSPQPAKGEPDPKPLDYTFFPSRGDHSETGFPPVWISVAGRDAFWPINIERPKGTFVKDNQGKSVPYTIRAAAVDAGQNTDPEAADHAGPKREWITLTALTRFLFIIIVLAFLVHGLAYLLSIKELPVNLEFMWLSVAKPLRWLQSRLQNWADDELPIARLFDSSRGARKETFEEPILHERRRFLLICFTILGLVTFWMLRLFVILMFKEFRTEPQEYVWLVVLFLFIVTAIVGFVVTAIDRASWARRLRAYSASKSGPAKKPLEHGVRHFYVTSITAFLMFVPAFLSGWWLCSVLIGDRDFLPIFDKLLLIRTLNPGNGVSQIVIVLCISAAVYIWACWNVSQLSMKGDHYDADCGLFRLLGGEAASKPHPELAIKKKSSGEPLRLELAAILASPWRRTRLWLLAGVLFTVVVYGFFTWDYGYGIDGDHFSRFVWWATLLAVFVFAHSLSQTLHLSILLGRVLRNLGAHPLASAFKRIAEKSLFNWRLPVRPSRARQLLPALNLAQSILTPYQKSKRNWLVFSAYSIRQEPDKAFLRNIGWRNLIGFAARVKKMLERGPWQPSGQDSNPKWTENGENLLALLASFVIRDMLSRLVGGFTAALAMAILICGAHMFYPFQGRHLFIWLDLSIIAILVLLGAATLLHFDKDKVLSLARSSTPGRINWTGSLMYRTIIGVAISLLTILAARFPELGMNLTSWMEPFRNLP